MDNIAKTNGPRTLRAIYLILGVAVLMVAAALPAVAAESSRRDYMATDLGTLGGSSSDSRSISNRGQIVGLSEPEGWGNLGYLYEHGEMTALYPSTGSGTWVAPLAVNERGQIVGQASLTTPSGSNKTTAFLWQDGVWTDLIPENVYGAAYDINDSGDVVGERVDPSSDRLVPFIRRNGTLLDLGGMAGVSAINNREQVVGYASKPGGLSHAALWTDGLMTDLGALEGGSFSRANDISDTGYVVGTSFTPSGTNRAFIWYDGIMTDLGTLGGAHSSASAVNARGQVVGRSNTATGEYHAFVWYDGVMTDLGTLGGTASSAGDINDTGQIVGTASTATEAHHATLWTTKLIDVCHVVDDDPSVTEWRLLGVNDRAIASHLAHGDVLPGGEVPGTNGAFVFDETCVLQATERIFAVAYTDMDTADGGYNAGVDVLIAKLVDGPGTANDGLVGAGDLVVTNQYPRDFGGSTFGDFTVTEHVITGSINMNAEICSVYSNTGAFHWRVGTLAEFYREYDQLDLARRTSIEDSLHHRVANRLHATADSPSHPAGPLSPTVSWVSMDEAFVDVEQNCAI